MLFSLIKKDFLIVKKYVLIMLAVIVVIPPIMCWQAPEFLGDSWFILSVCFPVFLLLQYVSLKEYRFPKAAALLCATPFLRKMMVLSKYIFCIIIYVLCCVVYSIEAFVFPGLVLDIKLFALMFFAVSVYIGIYLPMQYKFGFDKAKYIYMVAIVTSPMYLPVFTETESPSLDFLSVLSPYLVCGGIVLIGIAVLAISAALSVKIYKKADLA